MEYVAFGFWVAFEELKVYGGGVCFVGFFVDHWSEISSRQGIAYCIVSMGILLQAAVKPQFPVSDNSYQLRLGFQKPSRSGMLEKSKI